MKQYTSTDVDIWDMLTWGVEMPIYYIDEDANIFERITEIFWIGIMYIGLPVLNIIEWINWEIKGVGPRKPSRR